MPKAISVYASLRTDKISKKTKQAPIHIRVKVYREEARFPTDLYATREEWDFTKQLPKKNPLLTAVKNSIAKLEQHLLTELATESEISMQNVRDFYSGKRKTKPEHEDFYEHFQRYIDKKEKGGNVSEGTLNIYNDTLKFLKEFRSKVKISDISIEFVEDFDDYLATVRNNAGGGRENRHKKLRAVILHLEKRKYPIKNPYGHGGFTIPTGNVRDTYLTIEEFHKLRNLVQTLPPNSVQRQALQMFIFACSTGMRIGDIQSLRWGEINQKGLIHKVQGKTKNKAIIHPHTYAIEAVDDACNKESKGASEDLIFKFYSQNTLREHLHKIVKKTDIEKTVTYHVGRHTFATLLEHAGVPRPTIATMLGHKSIDTTAIYTKLDEQTVETFAQSEVSETFLAKPKSKKKPK